MNLMTGPDTVNFPEAHYVFMERKAHISQPSPRKPGKVSAPSDARSRRTTASLARLRSTKPNPASTAPDS